MNNTIVYLIIFNVLFFVLLFFALAFLLFRIRKEQEKYSNEQALSLQKNQAEHHEKLLERLGQNQLQHYKTLSEFKDSLTLTLDRHLKEIGSSVEKRLFEGFEKTTLTFSDVVKRLALIDEAQKKITELSTNVVSLQEILSDKRSRGAFGEVQLSALIRNVLPEKTFAFQHTLSNGKRADCILFLPNPTGNMVIDAKFPLESYRRMTNTSLAATERAEAESQFRQDIRIHIKDVASKYIIPGETSDGAVIFIPAEAIFAEIHAHFPDIIDYAHASRVWIVSPTTMMAILTTIRAVLKDEATREHIHTIFEHLKILAKDFERFQVRMGHLAKHIEQAHTDVEEVNQSAQKITARFNKIERVDIPTITAQEPEEQ